MLLCVCRDAPPVIVQADNVSVTPGDIAQLICVVQSSVEFNVTWLRLINDQLSQHPVIHNGTAVIRLLI